MLRKVFEAMMGRRPEPGRWVDERFLQRACEAMSNDLDWDSLDSGRLHRATSCAKMLTGDPILVGVLDKAEQLPALLDDAQQECGDQGLPLEAPLWLYVPRHFRAPADLPDAVVIKRVA